MVIAFTAIVLALGCAGGSGAPVTLDLQNVQTGHSDAINSTHLWGVWDVTLNPATQTAEIAPVRGAAFTCNVTQFMQPPSAPKNLMTVAIDPSSDWDTGLIICDVSFTHPFPGLDQFTGFDVRGVCIGNGTQPGIADPSILYGGDDELRILNADGLTRWFNPSEFTSYDTIFGFTSGKAGVPGTAFSATLNGYKCFCDGLGAEDDIAEFFGDPSCHNPRGYFSAGNTRIRRYEIQFPMVGGSPQFYFQYAVVASWEPPEPNPPGVIPDDFSLSANCQESYCISVVDESEMYYSGTGGGGTMALRVRVFDHQGAENPFGVSAEIGAIHLETQNGLISTGNIASFNSMALGAALVGEDEISATYLLEVADVDPPGEGIFPVMIVVESADPNSYDQGFPGFDYPDGTLAAYFMTIVAVGSAAPPTVTAIDPDSGDLDELLEDVEVSGTDFLAGAEVTLIKNDDPGVVVDAGNEVVSGGGTLITCDLDLDSGAGVEVGTYHVKVTNPGGLFGQLDDGFEVEEAYSYWWKNIMYASSRGGYNPTATTADPEDLTLLYSVPAPQYYKYGTPVVAENKIIYTSHTTYYANSSVRVYVHDLETGDQLWNAQINPSGTYERYMPSYAFYKGDDGVERVLAGGDQLYCFDADSNGTNPSPLWTYDDTTGGNQNWLGTVFCVYEDMLISRGREYGVIYIHDVTDGSVIHRIDSIVGGYESGVSADNGKIYSNGSVWVECIDIETGTVDWSTQVPTGLGVSHYGPPCIADGRIYFGSYAGYVQVYATEDDGTYSPGDLIWTYKVPSGNPMNGGTAKLGNQLFCACAFSSSHVYGVVDNGSSGSLDWTGDGGYYDACITVTTTPSYPNGVVIAPERYGPINFVDATNGNLIRAINDGQAHIAGATLVGDYVVIVGWSYLSVYH